jgi:hypothetical protein
MTELDGLRLLVIRGVVVEHAWPPRPLPRIFSRITLPYTEVPWRKREAIEPRAALSDSCR